VVIAAVVVAVFALLGLREGVVRRLVEVVGALATLVLTARFAAMLAPRVAGWTGWSEGAALLAAWVVLIMAGLLLSRLLAVLLSKAVRLTVLGWVDRVGGMVCGAVFGLLVASLLVNVVAAVGGERVRNSLHGEAAGRFVAGAAPNIARQARLLAGDRFAAYWDKVRQDTDEALDRARDEARKKAEQVAGDAAGD
jgi:membrane protein required for colicin V production